MSVSAILIKFKRLQKDLLRVQAETVAWDDTQTDAEVEVAAETVKALREKATQHQEAFDLIATDVESATHDPTFETLTQSLTNLTIAIRKVTLSRSKAKDTNFKFEKLNLPTFSGKMSEWQEFSDLWKAAVHNNTSKTGAVKMIHLRDALKGEAATIIKNTPATASGYDDAWKAVEARYSNKREMVNSYLRKLHQMKSQSDTSTGIRRICDTVNECVRSLTLLGIDVTTWDVILVFLAQEKLDAETEKQWLLTQGNDLPKLSEFLAYLETRATALSDAPKDSSKSTVKEKASSSSHHTTTQGGSKSQCPDCGKDHPLYQCPQYKFLSAPEKSAWVKKEGLCYNCLGRHKVTECKNAKSCQKCGNRHHTSLHFDKKSTTSTSAPKAEAKEKSTPGSGSSQPSTASSQPEEPEVGAHTSSTGSSTRLVLMATVMVKVRDSIGKWQSCRIFLDSGSEANFVSEHAVSRLGLKRRSSSTKVTGMGGVKVDNARGIVSFETQSTISSFVLPVTALILPKLTNLLPRNKCQRNFPHLAGLSLADPSFCSPASIDLMLGAETMAQILLPGLKKGPPGTPIAQNSEFGWFLTGNAPAVLPDKTCKSNTVTANHSMCVADENLEASLQRFWELEDPSPPSSTSSEDELTEKHFLSTFTRDSEGRYEVQLPFSPSGGKLGDSRPKAISCFKSLEKQLQRDSSLKDNYHSQIEDYLSKGWVTAVPPHQVDSSNVVVTTTGGDHISIPPFYLPHHIVVKPENTTTKCRIVFNASAKTDSGNSLNSLLLPGTKIQTDLHPLLTRFRTHPIALGADIVKFYNQVKVFPPHWNFQRFVWRKEPTDPFSDLQFNRLVFGVTSAPFLAIRVLRQLGEESKEEFPLAHNCIQRDFLVDNLLSGANSVEEALEIKTQIVQVLTDGKFPLQKWISNHPKVMESIPPSERETFSFNIQEDDSIKTIGIFWHPVSDTFGVRIHPAPLTTATKRTILSHTARVFDPLQWLAPVTIFPKILLQTLWKEKLEWDEEISPVLSQKWRKYCQELEVLRNFRIPRCLTFSSPPSENAKYDLIGFCDASNLAYAACVYLRSSSNGITKVELLECKAKVAPVNGETTPRLELCSAVLLTKLINSIFETLTLTKITISSVLCFTDSSGALGQLFSKEKQPVFVANRVRKIRNSQITIHWYHVPGEVNPADLPSRGIPASNLLKNSHWLHGPPFLTKGELPPQPYTQTVASFQLSLSPGESVVVDHLARLITSKSSFTKMKRLIGYWIRFIHNSNKRNSPVRGPLTSQELERALIPIVKCIQRACFPIELELCSAKESVKGRLRFLSPFLDKNGILRVGGRLQNSSLMFQSKHPILLPKVHSRPSTPEQGAFGTFGLKIARDFHQRNLHAAPKLLLSLIRSEFWIIRGQDLCNRVFHQCIPCFRQHRQPLVQEMAPLPTARVVPDFPFIKVGLDYAGPFSIAAVPGRNPKLISAWVCVFVCMTTKAVHLEFSGGLSTADFISALQRFCSIRNSPSDIYCDRGTNFLGAKEAMDKLQNLINNPLHNEKVALFLTGEKVNFHFSPPKGPHHGGLWEAAVKSMKLHLYRIVQGHHISIEEFVTFLARISAALNSRPLTPLSNHPDDFSVITPFHFLTLRGPREIAEEDVTTMRSHSSRWQLVQQMTQHLFRRWSQDYLHHLQNRTKWLEPQPNITKGTMVLLHDSDAAFGPQRWSLARVEQVFPGKDGRVRTCDVKVPVVKPNDVTPKPGVKPNWSFKIFRRPITKLSPLPLDEEVTSAFTELG